MCLTVHISDPKGVQPSDCFYCCTTLPRLFDSAHSATKGEKASAQDYLIPHALHAELVTEQYSSFCFTNLKPSSVWNASAAAGDSRKTASSEFTPARRKIQMIFLPRPVILEGGPVKNRNLTWPICFTSSIRMCNSIYCFSTARSIKYLSVLKSSVFSSPASRFCYT